MKVTIKGTDAYGQEVQEEISILPCASRVRFRYIICMFYRGDQLVICSTHSENKFYRYILEKKYQILNYLGLLK